MKQAQTQELPREGQDFPFIAFVLSSLPRLQIVSVQAPPNKGDVEPHARNKTTKY